MSGPLVRIFSSMLGLKDYALGSVVTIRGKQYKFNACVEIYDAAQGNLGFYQVNL
jgi:hypothetical protein